MTMLPDEKIMCHRTGFTVSCYDGVTKHKCRLWCHVSGTDAKDQQIDAFGCGDELELKLIHEVAKEVRQSAASMDKVANEVKETRDAASVRDVLLINSIKANFNDRRWQRALDQAYNPSRGGLAGYANALGTGGPECSDPGHGGLPSQGPERGNDGGEGGDTETAGRLSRQAEVLDHRSVTNDQ